jgi:hypothetical protein
LLAARSDPIRSFSVSQAYRMSDGDGPVQGAAPFSMPRDSNKAPRSSLDRYFDTGRENNGAAS